MMLRRLATRTLSCLALIAPVIACTNTASITDAYTSIDQDGSRRRNVFFTDTEHIFCTAEMSIGRDDVTVEILVRQIIILDPQFNQIPANHVVANEEIHPAKGIKVRASVELVKTTPTGQPEEADDAPFPVGRYRCEVYLDKSPATNDPDDSIEFNILPAPCPTYTIIDGTRCQGFYRPSTVCPRFGLGTDKGRTPESSTCTCGALNWSCN